MACSLIDLGNRFRLIINDVTTLKQDKPMPKLPVASALWKPEPNLFYNSKKKIIVGDFGTICSFFGMFCYQKTASYPYRE